MNTLLYTIGMMNTIHTISTAFPSYTIVKEYNPTHLHISVPILEFMHAPIMKWKHSKSPDMLYCEELSQYYTNAPMDHILYLNYNSEQNQFEIYEGVDHFIALRILYNKYQAEKNQTIQVNVDIKTDKTIQELMELVDIKEYKDKMNGWCM